MLSQQASTPYTPGLHGPEWSARDTSDGAANTNAVRVHDAEPIDFIISSNWVLRTEGIKDFYRVLHKLGENWEIVYDDIIHGFRIKCLSYDEVKIVALVKTILDKLVQKESDSGLETSEKIYNLEDWRKKKADGNEKIEIPNKYKFPRDVALCNIQASWDIPEKLFKEGSTTSKILPEGVLSKLQELTGAVLLTSSDGRVVYIGASGSDRIRKAKQRLDTLARFFSLTPRDIMPVVKIFLYNEGHRSIFGEYRYVADGNDRLLRSYILDRFDWPHPNQRYPKIFQRSVIVRLNPDNEPWEESQSLSNKILPVVKDGNAIEEFGAFRSQNWKYPSKEPDSSTLESDTSSTLLGSSPVGHQGLLKPTIETWVSGLPALENKLHSVGVPHSQQPEATPIANIAANDHMLFSGVARQGYTRFVASPPVIEPKPTVDLKVGCPVNIRQSGIPLQNKATGHPMDSRQSSADARAFPKKSGQSQDNIPDPFQHLLGEFRRVSTKRLPGSGGHQNGDSAIRTPLSINALEPRLDQHREDDTRSFHVTMRQKAGSHMIPNNVFPEFDPNMIKSINESLTRLLAPLRMRPGIVDLGIELGRFYFLGVKKTRIQEPGEDDDEKHYKLDRIQNELNKKHTANEKLCFTRILTSLGADANYIAHITDHSGKQLWKRPTDGRSSIYEFTCRWKTSEGADFNFVVDIDATKFTCKVRPFEPNQNFFPVYCTKRVWDFRLVLSVSQDVNGVCSRFAEDLLRSLRVMPNGDRVPELEVSYGQAYDIEVLAVRTRNTACCVSETSITNTPTLPDSRKDVQRLHISEVWDMARLNKTENGQRIRLKFARFKSSNEHYGMPPMWYEAVMESDTLSEAFNQNERLELGNEVEWKSSDLLKSGVIEALIRKAANMVKKMDGVGYWNDNHQIDLIRGVSKPAKSQDVAEKFW